MAMKRQDGTPISAIESSPIRVSRAKLASWFPPSRRTEKQVKSSTSSLTNRMGEMFLTGTLPAGFHGRHFALRASATPATMPVRPASSAVTIHLRTKVEEGHRICTFAPGLLNPESAISLGYIDLHGFSGSKILPFPLSVRTHHPLYNCHAVLAQKTHVAE